jgi:Diacylglycerol kinase catalytic domain
VSTQANPLRRLAAVAALALVVVVVVDTLVRVAAEPFRVLAELVVLVVLLAAVWFVLTRTGAKRVTAVVVAVAAVGALIVLVAMAEDHLFVSLAVRIVGLGVAVWLARYALGTTTTALATSETPGTPVPAAKRGVLFMNLKSGGGKAEHFHLPDECMRRGIQPVVLKAGMDWLQTVRDVAASGVDVLGMAGGDGSQALVGMVAVEHGLPMVVVPAGTRNHLALDLGLDRDDVIGALDAYKEAVERTMDLADINGHVFVNNVSLGVYAAIVRSPDYRLHADHDRRHHDREWHSHRTARRQHLEHEALHREADHAACDGCRDLAHEWDRLRPVVLGRGPRWSSGSRARSWRTRIPLSRNGQRSVRRTRVVPQVPRLHLPLVQHRPGIQPDGCLRDPTLGEIHDVGRGRDLTGHRDPRRRSCHQHSQVTNPAEVRVPLNRGPRPANSPEVRTASIRLPGADGRVSLSQGAGHS